MTLNPLRQEFYFHKPEEPTSPEEELRERARQERLRVLAGYFEALSEKLQKLPKPLDNLASIAVNYGPLVNIVKMVGEAYFGETMSGKRLTRKGAAWHYLIQATNILGWGLGMTGHLKEGAVSYGISWGLDAIQYYPEIARGLKELMDRPELDQATRATLEKIAALYEAYQNDPGLQNTLQLLAESNL